MRACSTLQSCGTSKFEDLLVLTRGTTLTRRLGNRTIPRQSIAGGVVHKMPADLRRRVGLVLGSSGPVLVVRASARVLSWWRSQCARGRSTQFQDLCSAFCIHSK